MYIRAVCLLVSLGVCQVLPAQATGRDAALVRTLGPQDQMTVWALGAEELGEKPVRVDSEGFVDLPLVGRMRAGGLTVEQFKESLVAKLRKDIRDPHVAVNLVDAKSQPISIVGSVNTPGVYQLDTARTLVEALSLAGGLKQDAGYAVKITRRIEYGPLPLSNAVADETGRYSVAQVKLKSLLSATNPAENITIRPHDVISVPKADMIYVVGEVVKAGGFVLDEKETLSILQAVSLAGGLTHAAAPGQVRILRGKNGERKDVPVDVKSILSGRGEDIALQPEDILFVPNSAAKSAALRALEVGIQVGTGLVIWRR